jgi:tRNA(Ile)-lysidine synthase
MLIMGFVKTVAKMNSLCNALQGEYGLPYESVRLHLGPTASEDIAREQRYAWLRDIQQKHGADAVATAHHQDDVIETMIINIIRGTGWRGLCSLV